MNAKLGSGGVLVGKLELIGGVDLDVHFDRFHRWTSETHHIGAIAAFRQRFDLERAIECLRVVLQRDYAQHHGSLRIDENDSAFEQSWRSRKGAHYCCLPPGLRSWTDACH